MQLTLPGNPEKLSWPSNQNRDQHPVRPQPPTPVPWVYLQLFQDQDFCSPRTELMYTWEGVTTSHLEAMIWWDQRPECIPGDFRQSQKNFSPKRNLLQAMKIILSYCAFPLAEPNTTQVPWTAFCINSEENIVLLLIEQKKCQREFPNYIPSFPYLALNGSQPHHHHLSLDQCPSGQYTTIRPLYWTTVGCCGKRNQTRPYWSFQMSDVRLVTTISKSDPTAATEQKKMTSAFKDRFWSASFAYFRPAPSPLQKACMRGTFLYDAFYYNLVCNYLLNFVPYFIDISVILV